VLLWGFNQWVAASAPPTVQSVSICPSCKRQNMACDLMWYGSQQLPWLVRGALEAC
jgi:hypothetical protein